MAEFIGNKIEIPKENLIRNKNNQKWQEIRRASNIFASIILNVTKNIVDEKIDYQNFSIAEFCLRSDSIAVIVNMSFSVELAFKTILTYHKIPYNREHRLDELFNILPEHTKKLIIRYLNRNHSCLETKFNREQEFKDAIQPIGDLFVKYRYFFDERYNLKNFNNNLTLLINLFDLLLRYINYKLK